MQSLALYSAPLYSTLLRHRSAAVAAAASALLLIASIAIVGIFSKPASDKKSPYADAPPFVLCAPAGADAMLATDGRPRPSVRLVSSEPLAHAPGKRVTMVIVDFAPGTHSPPHRHGGSVSVYVLKGEIYSQLGDGPMGRFRAGDTFFEPLGIIHTASGNDTDTPAQVLAVFIHDEGATLTSYLD